jgi:hypothetical protein
MWLCFVLLPEEWSNRKENQECYNSHYNSTCSKISKFFKNPSFQINVYHSIISAMKLAQFGIDTK